MRIAAAMIIVGLLAWAAPVAAEELVLNYGDTAVEFGDAADRAYWIDFDSPVDWVDTVCNRIRFYGQGYGDNSKTLGAVVLYGPAEDQTELFQDKEGRLQILTRKVFDLADVPAEGGWVEISFDPVKLPGEFAVVIYTYNSEDRGVKIGLTDPTPGAAGDSGTFVIERLLKDGTTETTDYCYARNDDRHWLIQAIVADTLPPVEEIATADISGSGYAYFDDGEVDGYITSQRHGPMVKFNVNGIETVDRIYVYGQLDGAWFETEKLATAYLLDSDNRIIAREVLRYDRFVNEPCWAAVDFKDIKVSGDFYVLVEPLAKLDVQLMIGYDDSGENIGSLWGTAGSIGSWDTTAPEEVTNWMIRVHYK